MIRSIAVLGAGTMGHGIAYAAATGGFDTRLFDVSPEALECSRSSIDAWKMPCSAHEARMRRSIAG